MLNHHTHPTDPIRDKKTNAFDTSMASPFRQHSFTVRVSHRCIITAAECGRSRHRPSLGCILKVFEFGRSRHPLRWDPSILRDTVVDNGYIDYTYIYVYSSSLMVSFSSLYLSLWPLSDLLEHYPLVVWGVFACVVAVAVYKEDVLEGGVVVLPLKCEVYNR